MEKVDLVMVGAEGVAESGGIINKVMREVDRQLLYILCIFLDWHLSDCCDGKNSKQAFLCCCRKFQIRTNVSTQSR